MPSASAHASARLARAAELTGAGADMIRSAPMALDPGAVLLEESDDDDSDVWDDDQIDRALSSRTTMFEEGDGAEGRIEAELYKTVEELDAHSKRHLLRLLHNAHHDMEDTPGATSVADFLEEVGAEKNREFEIFEKNIHALKSFDLLLFRGSDFVSDFIIGLERKHRGVNFFSHVGICLAPPLLPRDGHYMRRGKVETGAKVLPFVQVRLQLDKIGSQTSADPAAAHSMTITVLQCRGLPSRLDEGGTKEDPYVRVSLTPYDDAENRNASFRTKTVWHGGHNPTFAAHHNNKGAIVLPAGPHELQPQLRVEIWDEDRISPDDLVGLHNLDVDEKLLEQMAQPNGTTRWLSRTRQAAA
jgi:hypothetical protein